MPALEDIIDDALQRSNSFHQAGTGAVDRSIWSKLGELVSVRDFGAVGDGVTDDTAAFQAAHDSLAGTGAKGVVYMPPGDYVLTQVLCKAGISWFGSGSGAPPHGGTILRQKPGSNLSLFTNNPATLPATEYWHWSTFRHFSMRGDAGSTAGCGIEVTCRVGEGFETYDLQFVDIKESGIRCLRGVTPGWFSKLHGFRCGEYLLDIQRTAADVFHSCRLSEISGDSQGQALIRIKGGGSTYETVSISGVKSEQLTTGAQQYTIRLEACNGLHVYIHDVSAISSDGALGVVHITGGSARVIGSYWRANSFIPNYIVDSQFAKNLPNTSPSGSTALGYVTWFGNDTFPCQTYIDGSGVRFGGPATLPIKHHNSASATLDFGEIAAGTGVELPITVTGARAGDTCIATPNGMPEAGLVWSAGCSANDAVRVRLSNITGSPIDPASRSWRADSWRH